MAVEMAGICPYCLRQTPPCETARAAFPPLRVERAGADVATVSVDASLHRRENGRGDSRVWGEGCPERCTGMVIGEAPGEWEEHLGRPFVGPSGQRLIDALTSHGASRTDFYITNIHKLRPRNAQGKNRPPRQREINSHWPHLHDEIETVRPVTVLLLGATATRTVC
jgi:uracil-DNA glycosylase